MDENTGLNQAPPQPEQPPTAPASRPRRLLPVIIIAAAIVVAGALVSAALIVTRSHTASVSSSGSPAQSAPIDATRINGKCIASTAPLSRLDSRTGDEPVLALPQPPGWVFNSQFNSELIRGVLVNTELRQNDFTPNAGVTLENLTGQVNTPQEALDGEVAGVITHLHTTLDSQTPGTVCGYPATTVTYVVENRAVTALVVAAQDSAKRIWAAVVTIQTTEPDNPGYIDAERAILDGFQFSLPSDLLQSAA